MNGELNLSYRPVEDYTPETHAEIQKYVKYIRMLFEIKKECEENLKDAIRDIEEAKVHLQELFDKP